MNRILLATYKDQGLNFANRVRYFGFYKGLTDCRLALLKGCLTVGNSIMVEKYDDLIAEQIAVRLKDVSTANL
jgi:hypothetical protein